MAYARQSQPLLSSACIKHHGRLKLKEVRTLADVHRIFEEMVLDVLGKTMPEAIMQRNVKIETGKISGRSGLHHKRQRYQAGSQAKAWFGESANHCSHGSCYEQVGNRAGYDNHFQADRGRPNKEDGDAQEHHFVRRHQVCRGPDTWVERRRHCATPTVILNRTIVGRLRGQLWTVSLSIAASSE